MILSIHIQIEIKNVSKCLKILNNIYDKIFKNILYFILIFILNLIS